MGGQGRAGRARERRVARVLHVNVARRLHIQPVQAHASVSERSYGDAARRLALAQQVEGRLARDLERAAVAAHARPLLLPGDANGQCHTQGLSRFLTKFC